MWSGVVWCGVVWCYLVLSGVVWCGGADLTLGDFLSTTLGLTPNLRSECDVLVQGIQPPDDTPLIWLYNNLSSHDLFLYIVVRKRI